MGRVILHIDMNSYFATVEQQANPLLRGKPIAVSGRPNIHSVVATASYEAKRFGVRAGMSTWEAKRLCSGMIFIPGDPNKYIDITGRLIKIFKSYSPLIEVFSIDEVFLDLTQSLLSFWGGACDDSGIFKCAKRERFWTRFACQNDAAIQSQNADSWNISSAKELFIDWLTSARKSTHGKNCFFNGPCQ